MADGESGKLVGSRMCMWLSQAFGGMSERKSKSWEVVSSLVVVLML